MFENNVEKELAFFIKDDHDFIKNLKEKKLC